MKWIITISLCFVFQISGGMQEKVQYFSTLEMKVTLQDSGMPQDLSSSSHQNSKLSSYLLNMWVHFYIIFHIFAIISVQQFAVLYGFDNSDRSIWSNTVIRQWGEYFRHGSRVHQKPPPRFKNSPQTIVIPKNRVTPDPGRQPERGFARRVLLEIDQF